MFVAVWEGVLVLVLVLVCVGVGVDELVGVRVLIASGVSV